MKKALCLLMGLFFAALTALPLPAARGEDAISWQDAYGSFILNQEYRRSGQKFLTSKDDAYEPPQFSLYDIDGDGVPELLASNADYTHASERTYVYGFENGRVVCLNEKNKVYLGGIRSLGYCEKEAGFPGLFDVYGQMGYGTISYCYLDQEGLKEERVTDFDYGTSDIPTFARFTNNKALYQVARDHELNQSFIGLTVFSETEIHAMGWDAFLAAYPYSAPPEKMDENPLIAPAEGETVALWNTKTLEIRWKKVPGAVRYHLEVRCTWKDEQGKSRVRLIYRNSFTPEDGEQGEEMRVAVPLKDMDVSGLPRDADIGAWVTMGVEK